MRKSFAISILVAGCVAASSMPISGAIACECVLPPSSLIPSAVPAQSDKIRASMAALMEQTGKLGSPNIEGVYPVGGESAPGLYFGMTRMNNSFDVVDMVAKEHGGAASLFVKVRGEYIRVATNVRNSDGSRAIGTILNPNGPAFAMINKGEAYYGDTIFFGEAFVTGYEPIRDCYKTIIGIYFVGVRK
jgi:hypothetical protein